MSTNIRNDIAAALRSAGEPGTMPSRVYALEAGLHVGMITGQRPFRVDSAELVSFIANTHPDYGMDVDDLADAIVDRFNLKDG